MATYIEITQVRSIIGRPESQRLIIKGLGLGKIRKTVQVKDTPAARGMVEKVQHLVDVRVFEGEAKPFGRRAKK